MNTNQSPSDGIIIGADGLPKAHIDLDRLQDDATMLMYELAATAGDDDATDQVGAKWVKAHDPDYYGYLAAGALSLLVRCVLAPTLDVAAELGVDLRPALRKSCDDALRDLGTPHTAAHGANAAGPA